MRPERYNEVKESKRGVLSSDDDELGWKVVVHGSSEVGGSVDTGVGDVETAWLVCIQIRNQVHLGRPEASVGQNGRVALHVPDKQTNKQSNDVLDAQNSFEEQQIDFAQKKTFLSRKAGFSITSFALIQGKVK